MEDKFKKTEYHLYQYKDIDKLNQINDIRIKKLRNEISLGGGDMFGEKSSPTNKFNSSVENDVIAREQKEIDKIVNQLRKDKENRIIEKELIEHSLELLTNEERKLIELRYFSSNRLSWDAIAMKLNVSVDTCIRMRRKIILELSSWIN